MTKKVILLDLDGTVYEGNRLIDGADAAIKHMRDSGLRVLFCTNNSSKPPSDIVLKLKRMGIACEESDIVSSGLMAIEYVISNKLKRIYVSGTDNLRKEFLRRGADICDENSAENLVISMDTALNYDKLTKVTRAALHANKIIVCNEDKLFPQEDGSCPGCGAIVAAVLFCTGKKADIILGKPTTNMLDYVTKMYGYNSEEMIIVGDSPSSDLKMAEDYSAESVLVGSERKNGLWVNSLKETINWDWTTHTL